MNRTIYTSWGGRGNYVTYPVWALGGAILGLVAIGAVALAVIIEKKKGK